eukprot:12884544-Prorocentrum_lima.AAC.1
MPESAAIGVVPKREFATTEHHRSGTCFGALWGVLKMKGVVPWVSHLAVKSAQVNNNGLWSLAIPHASVKVIDRCRASSGSIEVEQVVETP